ncbi:MAG TPA: carboxypeptidase regulatory-like domain-containing protein [Acidobacteriaceae bacterium]
MAFPENVSSWFRRIACYAVAATCLLLAGVPLALAQVDEGSVTGTVQDPSGAVVPNASVTLLNTDQGLSLQTHSDNAGSYVFSPVRIGNYTLTVTAAGFSTTTQEKLTVAVGQELQVNVSLKTGMASENVVVSTAPPQMQTEEASVGQVVTERSINSLPLNGRNFTFLAQLGAGVNTSQADTRGNSASGAFTANGLRPAQNNYLLDGIDNNSNAVDFLNGTNFVILPPVDAIQEFKVQTADYSAELGRAAGAVLNATIKTGTNSFHGAAWEFFRNDKLDAADYFETQGKGELRFNQFGASAGGPVLKNKIFFFGDYEGFRRVQGNTSSGVSVPTTAERTSGYTNLADVISGQASGSGNPTRYNSNPAKDRHDNVGRAIPFGTIMDPATTRAVTAGVVDPVTGRTATQTGFVRDPINLSDCAVNSASFDNCTLNQIPAGRLDPNAVKLLNLFPQPTNSSFSGNFVSSPHLFEHRNAFDTRVDFNPSQKDQVFFRFSYVDDPEFLPGPFGGVADGGAFQQGLQTAKSDQAVVGYTHVFTPSTINVVHAGFNHLHTTRFGPEGTTPGIPAQYGIQGIPQSAENGGLPAIVISGLSELGSNDFLPSDEVSQTLQITDDFTKIYGKNSFKMGVEYQDVHFNTLQPAYSRGEFDFNCNNNGNGNYVGVSGQCGDNVQRAQFLITPTNATVPNGVNGIGGANQVHASNISKTYDIRTYLAGYFQDDLKINSKLTLNLGLRYDYFSPIAEANGGQANFVQTGPPNGGPTYIIPATGKDLRALSPSFLALTAKDGIAIDFTNKYGKGVGQAQKANFAPRFGFAYEVSPRLVARGGVGLFFNAFENQGYGPNIGENYPFIYNFNFQGTTDAQPFSTGSNPYGGCATAGVGGSAPIGSGLSCTAFTPTAVNASGLGLQGLQFNFQTPRTVSANLSFQYALTRNLSAQVSYVLTDASNLQAGIGDNEPFQLVPANTSLKATATQPINYIPFPDFGEGSSYQRTIGSSIYNGLQTKVEQQLSNGLNFLAAYTYSKTLTDAGDLLNGGSTNGFRAPWVPGLGPRFDWGLASFDIRNVFHLSGGYELPFGKGRMFLANSGKMTNQVLGGWSTNFIVTLQGGQPLSFSCPSATTSGTNCNDILVPGQSQKLGIHKDKNNQVSWIGNPAAFQQPCELGPDGPIVDTPTGCIPATGPAVLGGGPSTTYGPGFHRFDVSLFKAFQISERVSTQFRAEFFNVLNHPNFNAPNFGGNGISAISGSGNFNSSAFGEIGSTRDAPYDPRQIQFALKLYY